MKKLIIPFLTLLIIACNLFQTTEKATSAPTSVDNPLTPTAAALPSATSAEISFTSTAETYTSIPSVTMTEFPTKTPRLTSTLQATKTNPQLATLPYLKAGEPVKLTTIHMVNTTDGWGISEPYILVTRDGGRTWREVTPAEPFPSGVNVEVFGAFPDSQTAWVIFSFDSHISSQESVWYTTDGGHTWKSSPPLMHNAFGDSVWAEFATLDAQTGWLAIRGAYVGAGSHYNTQLFRTTNGGATWTSLTNSDDVDIAFRDYTGLVFFDRQTGWLTWQDLDGAFIFWPASYAMTTDGGLTWESHNLPAPVDVPDLYNRYWYCESYQTNILSLTAIRLLVECAGGELPRIGYLYATEDGGSTWQTYRLPVAPNVNLGDKLIFFNPKNGYLLGQKMLHTTNGGRTWTAMTTVAWDKMQFDLISAQVGWAIVSIGDLPAALVKTSDGCKTWQEIKPVIGP